MFLSGTSMATAVTTASIALLVEANRNANAYPQRPSLTPNTVKAILEYTSVGIHDDAGVERADRDVEWLRVDGRQIARQTHCANARRLPRLAPHHDDFAAVPRHRRRTEAARRNDRLGRSRGFRVERGLRDDDAVRLGCRGRRAPGECNPTERLREIERWRRDTRVGEQRLRDRARLRVGVDAGRAETDELRRAERCEVITDEKARSGP